MKYFLLISIFFFSSVNAQKLKTEILKEEINIYTISENKIKVNNYAKKLIYDVENNPNAYFLHSYEERYKPKIKYIKIYDRYGKLLKNVNKTEIVHTNLSANKTLYNKHFTCFYELKRPELPYIIEYEYEQQIEDILNYPTWQPQDKNCSVSSSKYSIHSNQAIDLKTKFYNFEPKVEAIEDKGNFIYSWHYKSTDTLQRLNKLSYKIYNGKPTMMIRSDNFLMKDIEGSFKTWKDFGNFYYYLNKDKKEIPEDLKKELTKLKNESENEKDLLTKVYQYLQSTKRYVFINLDLGGYQSMSVEDIHTNSYGDCKALSNYLETSLNFVGIESYSALVKGSSYKFNFEESFVCNQFNHVICCAIIEQDTFWLESTSNKEAFNYLSSFTSGRPALIIKENQSKLITTPSYLNEFNFSIVDITTTLNDNKQVTLVYNFELNGLNQDEFRQYLYLTTDSDIKKYLNYYFDYLNDYKIIDYEIKEISKTEPKIFLEVEIEKQNFYQRVGDNFLINLNVFSPLKNLPSHTEEYKTEVFYPYGINESFKLNIDFSVIEKNIHFVDIKETIDNENMNADYEVTKINDQNIQQTLSYTINTFKTSSENFNEEKQIFKTLYDFFNTKIIVKTKK